LGTYVPTALVFTTSSATTPDVEWMRINSSGDTIMQGSVEATQLKITGAQDFSFWYTASDVLTPTYDGSV
jgi:hypothetical protein